MKLILLLSCSVDLCLYYARSYNGIYASHKIDLHVICGSDVDLTCRKFSWMKSPPGLHLASLLGLEEC